MLPRAPTIAWAALVSAVVTVGCNTSSTTPADATGVGRGVSNRAADPVGPLTVPSFRDAVIVEPTGTRRRPVIIVLHGSGDSPDGICPAFDALVKGRAWIVCPRGSPLGRGWTFPSDQRTVATEVHAALGALARRFPDRVEPADPLLAGFSLGAMYAAFLARDAPATFRRAFVVDTRYVWTREQIGRYAKGGGQAALFVCSRTYLHNCQTLVNASGSVVGSPIPVRCLLVPDREHGYDRVLFERMGPDFEALVATDPRWASQE